MDGTSNVPRASQRRERKAFMAASFTPGTGPQTIALQQHVSRAETWISTEPAQSQEVRPIAPAGMCLPYFNKSKELLAYSVQ